MPIEFVCSTCQSTLRVGDESAGRTIRCGGCLTALTVPGGPDPSPPPEAVPTSAGRGRGDDFEPRPSDPDGFDDRPRPRDRDGPDDRDDRYDGYDRPRRRRRRRREFEPPPPPGRGPLFWMGVLGAVFVLGTGLCCGGLYLALPGPNWQRHQSPKGGFAVDLPAPARDDLGKMAGGPPTPGMTVEGAILIRKAEEYVVVWGDVPPQNRFAATDEERLTEAVNGFKTSGEIRDVVSQKDITVGGFLAREVECRANGGGWYTARVIAADTRVYVLVGGGRFTKPGSENVRRFLDSFEITDPRLKAAGQRREDARKQGEKVNRWGDIDKKEPDPKDGADEAWRKRRLEEERAAAERAERERVAREAKWAQARVLNGQFLEHKYDGPLPPAAEAGWHAESFEAPGDWATGPGVRGKGAYLATGRTAVTISGRPTFPERRLKPLLGQPAGFTAAGWFRFPHSADPGVMAKRTRERLIVLGIGSDSATFYVSADPGKLSLKAWGGKQIAPPELIHKWSPDDRWHHVAVVSDRDSAEAGIRLYFDGRLVASWSGLPPLPDGGETVELGKFWGDGRFDLPPESRELLAAVDEFRIAPRPLTEEDVAALVGLKFPPRAPAPRPVARP